MSKDEPTFTYNGTANEDANRKAREEAAMDAIQRAQIRQAQEQATREHQWEHKQPAVHVPFGGLRLREQPVGFGVASDKASAQARTFTREEVLAVLRFHRAGIGSGMGHEAAYACMDRLLSMFERME